MTEYPRQNHPQAIVSKAILNPKGFDSPGA
jgi:hypothetical protein